jgi:hypothetical protein
MSSPKNGTTTSADANLVRVISVHVTTDKLEVDLEDGRTHRLPLAWYPRLQHGTPKERNTWQLIARGRGMHWPLLDEDLSAQGLLAGRQSGESERSFAGWLAGRPKKPIPQPISRRLPLRRKSIKARLATSA